MGERNIYDVDPNHLRIYELNYELKVRNLNADKVDTASKRKFLRKEFRKDASRPGVFKYKIDKFDFDSEKTEVSETIQSVTELVENFDGINDEVSKRIRSRLNHVFGRLSRFPDDVNDEISNYKGDSIISVSILEDDLEDIINKHKEGEKSDNANLSTISGTIGGEPRSVPVYKWNITFDGASSKGSVNSFLRRVEELRVSRNCRKAELFQSASDLFKGFALEWYRSQLRQQRFNSWDSLVIALRRDFLPVDYDDQLKLEILKRTQGQNERVIIFISIMENLFDCLSILPSEAERLKIIRNNLLPSYQKHLALRDIGDIAKLSEVCRALEEAENIERKFVPPPRRNISALEPGLVYDYSIPPVPSTSNSSCERCACRSNSSTIFTNHGGCRDSKVVNSRVPRQVAGIRCFRCNERGHTAQVCKNKSTTMPICYGCGNKGVIRPNCPNCSKTKNGLGGDRR